MITLALGFCFSYEEQYTLENCQDISGWELIHSRLEKLIAEQKYNNLKLFQYRPKHYCLAIKIYEENNQIICEKQIPIKSMYEDFTTFDLLPFNIMLKYAGLKNPEKYHPQLLALSNQLQH